MINILLNAYNIDSDWCYDALKDILKEHMQVTVIAFSFRDVQVHSAQEWQLLYGKSQGRYYKTVVEPFSRYGISEEQITWVDYYTDTRASALEKIKQCQVVYLMGGLPDRTMDRLLEFELTDALENHSGIVMGFSAGAMVQIADYHISPDSDYAEFAYAKGLNMIKDFDIEVHYEFDQIQKDSIEKAIREKGKTIYAMEDTGGLIVENGKVTCMGDVHHYPANQ